MSESGSVHTDSTRTGQDGSGSGLDPPGSDQIGTSLPLMLVQAYQEQQGHDHRHEGLPKLPSHRFRYSTWHELSNTEVKGSDLHAPRVRYGPPEKEKYFYKIRDENNMKIHHSLKGKERRDYRDQTENWEQTIVCNLSYQELGQNYQKENFIRVLRRLQQAEYVSLVHNELQDLSSITFNKCTRLNINTNYINSLKKLPKVPQIKALTMEENDVEDLAGLETLHKAGIQYLNLRNNPVAFTLNYRQRVFQICPNLAVLDNVPRQPADDVFEPEKNPEDGSSCVIS